MREIRDAGVALLVVTTSMAVVLLGILASSGDTSLRTSDEANACQPPPGWQLAAALGPADTLEEVALRYETTAAEVRAANCLPEGPVSLAGRRLYLPSEP